MTAEANRAVIDQGAYLDENSNLRNSLNLTKAFYTTILKQPIRTVRPASSLVYVPAPVSASLNVSESSHDLTQVEDSLLEILQSLGVRNDSNLEPNGNRTQGSFSSDSVFSKKLLSKTKLRS